MTAQVYSYRRFSSSQQKHGGSIERQLDYAKTIAQEHNLKLNEALFPNSNSDKKASS